MSLRSPVPASRAALHLATRIAVLGGCFAFAHPAVAFAAPGDLVPTFGSAGFAELEQGTQFRGAALQADGRIVAVGSSGGPTTPALLVSRFLPGGALDPAFGAGGRATIGLPAGATGLVGEAVALRGDGRLVVAGSVRSDSGADGVFVARLLPDGSLDTAFGAGGVVTVARGFARAGEASAVALTAGEGIVVGGAARPASAAPVTGLLIRLGADGAVLGESSLDIGEASIRSLAVQPDGRIVFVGERKLGLNLEALLGRFTPDGAPDGTFRGGGVAVDAFQRNGGGASGFRDVALASDGAIVATGYAFDAIGAGQPGVYRVTARYGPAGTPDPSFGGGVTYTAAARTDQNTTTPAPGGAGIALVGGRVVTGGTWDEFGVGAVQVQAQEADGGPAAFGTGGVTISPLRAFETRAYGNDVAHGDGTLFTVGVSGTGTRTRAFVSLHESFSAPGGGPPGPPQQPPGAGGGGDSGPEGPGTPPRAAAKLRVVGSGIEGGRLRVRVQASSLASGARLRLRFASGGRTSSYRLSLPTATKAGEIARTYRVTLPSTQRRATTGIVELALDATDRSRADDVRLRIARNPARLVRGRTEITAAGRLVVTGTVARRATGVVRVRLEYDEADGGVGVLNRTATIRAGRWSLDSPVSERIRAVGGQLSIQYTGNERTLTRGEQTSKQVAPRP